MCGHCVYETNETNACYGDQNKIEYTQDYMIASRKNSVDVNKTVVRCDVEAWDNEKYIFHIIDSCRMGEFLLDNVEHTYKNMNIYKNTHTNKHISLYKYIYILITTFS